MIFNPCRRFPFSLSGLSLAALLSVFGGCAGEEDILPFIVSFTASPEVIHTGETSRLTAVFGGGEGEVEPDVGPVSPSVGVTVGPAETTTYTLTVKNTEGVSVSEEVSLAVIPDRGFTSTGSLGTARFNHTATLLSNGKVLVAGGGNSISISAAELYDPSGGTFSPTGTLGTARQLHTATLLSNGLVLISGGGEGNVAPGDALVSAELYDPAAGTFSPTGNLGFPRWGHTATALPDGRVLITGGTDGITPPAVSELYNPVTGTFSPTGILGTAREGHSATLLNDGRVLIAGGSGGVFLSSAELYDPATGTFSPTGGLGAAKGYQTGTGLGDGTVLIAGGFSGTAPGLDDAELYIPAAGSFFATGGLDTRRHLHTATLLPGDVVLIAGGFGFNALSSAELYQ